MRNSRGQFANGSDHLVKHGMSKSSEYGIWQGMRTRCQNINSKAYKNYGARGIFVCDRWKLFENFYADMGQRPEGLTLERKNNDGPYSPENCKWATPLEQSRNQRGLVIITIDSVAKPLAEWAEQSPVAAGTIWARLKNKWEPKSAVFTPKVARLGIKRGVRLRDHQPALGHGVAWSEPHAA